MLGLMQAHSLTVPWLLQHAARHHAGGEVISQTGRGVIHRGTWADTERRARRLVRVLQGLGIEAHDRVGTLAWNDHRHLETYYAASGMQAICHTINPRLSADDITYIINHAGDSVLFVDPGFAPLIGSIAANIANSVRAVVMLTDAASMPALELPSGMRLLCYDELLAASDDDYEWPQFDENTASALCYTSGTTGRPKGALYSHRSTVLHAYAIALPDVLDMRASSRILPVVPMFHVNAWGIPYAAALTGATLVLPGRHLDGPNLTRLLNQERVTMSCGVPTVWLALLQHTRTSGEKLTTVKRIMTFADRGVPRRAGRRGGAWLGDDRAQSRRHLQRRETRAGRADRAGSRAAHAETGPRSIRDRHEDRRRQRARAAVGRQAVRRPDGAWTMGVQRLFRRCTRQCLRRRRMVRHR
jgi:acyl-CoA synthetase (AMP-forming)/AMP-acid ligase II